MNRTRRLILTGSAAAIASAALARVVAPRVARLRHAMLRNRFVSYQPTAIAAFDGKLTRANDASIRADLQTLRPWFDGLVTYSALNGAERVADIAAGLDFRAMIVGVWDIFNHEEIQNAVVTA